MFFSFYYLIDENDNKKKKIINHKTIAKLINRINNIIFDNIFIKVIKFYKKFI